VARHLTFERVAITVLVAHLIGWPTAMVLAVLTLFGSVSLPMDLTWFVVGYVAAGVLAYPNAVRALRLETRC
jgi:hypothetical protein